MVNAVTSDGWLAAGVTIFSLLVTGVFIIATAGIRALLRMVRDIQMTQGKVNEDTLNKTVEIHNKVDGLLMWAAYQQGKSGMPLSHINIDSKEVESVAGFAE